MAKSKNHRLARFGSTEKLAGYFDSHDMGEHWEQWPEVRFDVDIKKRRFLVSVDEQVMDKLMQLAKARHTSAPRLINRWLKEKLVAVS